jgi:NADPH:quinone reductase-like Zn-dependent oxidoreductase
LFDHAKLQPGERVLIHGGAGAVGVFAIQLARLRHAEVTTTVSARSVEFVKELGADHVIDYTKTRFEEHMRDADVVFDAVGGDTLRRSWSVLKGNGRMVTIAAGGETTQDERVQQAFFIVEPNRRQLMEIEALLDARSLRAVVDTVIPLSRAAEAYAGTVERTGQGKLVVAVAGA